MLPTWSVIQPAIFPSVEVFFFSSFFSNICFLFFFSASIEAGILSSIIFKFKIRQYLFSKDPFHENVSFLCLMANHLQRLSITVGDNTRRGKDLSLQQVSNNNRASRVNIHKCYHLPKHRLESV